MRTQEEIAARIKAKQSGFMDFTADALIQYLDFEHAKEFLKPEVTAEEWSKSAIPFTRERIIAAIKDYMAFAWDKARNHRGLSASRSISKMEAWVWALNDEGLEKRFEAIPYENYGAPKLTFLCKEFEIPIPVGDDVTRMSQGLACVDGCDSGCGA